MEFDPHTLHQILQRIRQQMRCPQCGERVPVDFASVRLTGDSYLLLQLKCDACDAYIVLHASLQGSKLTIEAEDQEKGKIMNASSSICLKDAEVLALRQALARNTLSFEDLFKSQAK